MESSLSDVAIQFQQVAKSRFIRILGGTHQLDTVLQKVYSVFGDK